MQRTEECLAYIDAKRALSRAWLGELTVGQVGFRWKIIR
jgi:hypothetical protein